MHAPAHPYNQNSYQKLVRLYFRERNYEKASEYIIRAESKDLKMDPKVKKKVVVALQSYRLGGKKKKKTKGSGPYLKIYYGAGFLDSGDFDRMIEVSENYYENLIYTYNWQDVSTSTSFFFHELPREAWWVKRL